MGRIIRIFIILILYNEILFAQSNLVIIDTSFEKNKTLKVTITDDSVVNIAYRYLDRTSQRELIRGDLNKKARNYNDIFTNKVLTKCIYIDSTILFSLCDFKFRAEIIGLNVSGDTNLTFFHSLPNNTKTFSTIVGQMHFILFDKENLYTHSDIYYDNYDRPYRLIYKYSISHNTFTFIDAKTIYFDKKKQSIFYLGSDMDYYNFYKNYKF